MMKKRLVCLCLSFLCLLSFCACQPALSPMEEVQQAVTKTSEQNGFDFSGELLLTMESGDISMSYGPVKLRMKTQMEEDMPVAFETQAKITFLRHADGPALYQFGSHAIQFLYHERYDAVYQAAA